MPHAKQEALNDDGLTFSAWLARANERVEERVGLALDDLPDACTWDAWNDGIDPVEFADDVLAQDGLIED